MNFYFRSESFKCLKRIRKIIPKRLLNREIQKAGLKLNPGLVLIALRTTGPCRREKTVVSLLNFEQFLVLFFNDADFLLFYIKST